MSTLNLIIGGIQLIAGIVLMATGIGGALGLKLILSGALSLIAGFMSAKAGRGGVSSSSAYGFNNLSNAARAGGAVPIVYGRHIRTPECINLNQTQVGDKQVLDMLLLLSEGPISGIGQVFLNGQKIETFGGTTETKLGTSDQTAFTQFAMGGTGYDAGTRLGSGTTHVYDMRDGAVDELALGFAWPGGLWKQKKDGGVDEEYVAIAIHYKAYGAADSTYKPYPMPRTAAGAPLKEPTSTDPWYGNGNEGTFVVRGKSSGMVRKILRLKFNGATIATGVTRPAKARYTIRVTGSVDDIQGHVRVPTLASVLEIRSQSVAYANRALLAVKCPAVEQLGTSLPRVSVVIDGRTVYNPTTATTAWSDNPAWCLRDLLLSERYGLGQWITSDMIDDGVGGTWRTVGAACDALVTKPGVTAATEKHWTLNYVMDVKSPATDYLTEILSSFRAQLFAADGKIMLGQDTTGASTHSFEDRDEATATTRRNVVHQVGENGYGDRSLLSASILEDAQRWNVVRCYYIDAERDWSRRYLELRNKTIAASGGAGTFTAGETVKVGTAKTCRFVFERGGIVYYVQDDGATALASGETMTGQTSGATRTTTAAPVTAETPERALEVNLFGVTRRTQAMREMRYHLNTALMRPIFVTIPIGIGDVDVTPCDVIDVSSDRPGAWSAKLFTAIRVEFSGDGLGAITAREYVAGAFVDTIDSTVVDLPTSTPGGGPAGSGPAANKDDKSFGGNTAGGGGGGGGTTFGVGWTPPATETKVTVSWSGFFGNGNKK